MSQKAIDEIHRENLCTYFVLPLLKLNKLSFVASSNFIDSYLSRGLDSIFVEVVEYLFFQHRMLIHPYYDRMWQMDSNYCIQYRIPSRWAPDLKLFITGRYSRMSKEAKEMICNHSGLGYRVREEPTMVPVTDIRLLALDRSKAVKDMWENEYGVLLDDEDELLSKPTEKIYIRMDRLTPMSEI